MPDIRNVGSLDDFNRANENPLSNGGRWSRSGIVADNLRLLSNAATLLSGKSSGSMYWNVRTWDSEVIEVWGIAQGGNAAGIAWTLEMFTTSGIGTSGVDGYRIRQEVSTGGGSQRLYRVTNAATTAIATGSTGFTSGISSPCLLYRYTKSTKTHDIYYAVSPWTSWTHSISKVDATHVPPFYLGIALTDNSASSLHGWTDFGGGILLTPTTFPQIIRRTPRLNQYGGSGRIWTP